MAEKPIIFNTEMVRAILDGRKTQTRRPIKPQPPGIATQVFIFSAPEIPEDLKAEEGCYYRSPIGLHFLCKFPYQISDRLWVRETWRRKLWTSCGDMDKGIFVHEDIFYKSDGLDHEKDFTWRPSIHMPKSAARMWLEVMNVRVERLQDISFDDAIAEGCKDHRLYGGYDFDISSCVRANFHRLWDSFARNFYRWDFNPWVWVIEFRRIDV